MMKKPFDSFSTLLKYQLFLTHGFIKKSYDIIYYKIIKRFMTKLTYQTVNLNKVVEMLKIIMNYWKYNQISIIGYNL